MERLSSQGAGIKSGETTSVRRDDVDSIAVVVFVGAAGESGSSAKDRRRTWMNIVEEPCRGATTLAEGRSGLRDEGCVVVDGVVVDGVGTDL